ncbi:PepSY domain-containing protein [Listeria kieliensis]|uniref:PepSY domain-containing protein n=1 Tax=Listeria kieliensis TaxID=1621700 RepID=A0A3D8TPK0_9LIST|nr:PepSY domain-containing protein [Listeria kieliensis]RDX00770.1 hypothetical protein UR08_07250 [Listeria kieliensis]
MKKWGILAVPVVALALLGACGNDEDHSKHEMSSNGTKSEQKSSTNKKASYDLNGKKLSLSFQDVIKQFEDKYGKAAAITSVELEEDSGRILYSVEGMDDQNEYKLKLDAESKEVLEDHKEAVDSEDKRELDQEKLDLNGLISESDAMKKAVAKVEGPVSSIELDRSYQDTVYDVSVETGSDDSEVRINAKTGKVLSVDPH